jgi:hypothetical protein
LLCREHTSGTESGKKRPCRDDEQEFDQDLLQHHNRLLWSLVTLSILPSKQYAKAPGCLDSNELIPSTKNGEIVNYRPCSFLTAHMRRRAQLRAKDVNPEPEEGSAVAGRTRAVSKPPDLIFVIFVTKPEFLSFSRLRRSFRTAQNLIQELLTCTCIFVGEMARHFSKIISKEQCNNT